MAPSNLQNQVTTALKELNDCPEAVKQMFLTGIPHAFGPESHQYQKELASLLRKQLETSRALATDAQQSTAHNVKEAQTLLDTCHAEVQNIQSSEDAARALLDEEVAALEQSKATVLEEESLCKNAKSSKECVSDERQGHETAKAEAESVKNGSFQMLLDGGWEDEEVRDACIAGVCNYLQEQHGDAVLLAALPKALSFAPAQRGPFDTMTVDAALQTITEKVSTLTEQLAAGEEKYQDAEAEYLGAWAVLDMARDQEKTASKKRERTASDLEDISANKKLAVAKVTEQDRNVATVLSEATLLDCKVQQLELALGALDKLEAGEEEEDAEVADKENTANVAVADCKSLSMATKHEDIAAAVQV